MSNIIKEIEAEQLKANIDDFAVGDTIKIVSGPLESFIGTINSLNFASQKANVKVNMFERETDVELDFVQIQKVN